MADMEASPAEWVLHCGGKKSLWQYGVCVSGIHCGAIRRPVFRISGYPARILHSLLDDNTVRCTLYTALHILHDTGNIIVYRHSTEVRRRCMPALPAICMISSCAVASPDKAMWSDVQASWHIICSPGTPTQLPLSSFPQLVRIGLFYTDRHTHTDPSPCASACARFSSLPIPSLSAHAPCNKTRNGSDDHHSLQPLTGEGNSPGGISCLHSTRRSRGDHPSALHGILALPVINIFHEQDLIQAWHIALLDPRDQS